MTTYRTYLLDTYPADQDVLHDTLLSTLYDFPLAVRTTQTAKRLQGQYAFVEAVAAEAERRHDNWSEARLHAPPVPWHSREALERLAKRTRRQLERGLGRLHVTTLGASEPFGRVVHSPHLTSLMSVFASSGLTCTHLCGMGRARRPFAVHCGGKHPDCLRMAGECECVGVAAARSAKLQAEG